MENNNYEQNDQILQNDQERAPLPTYEYVPQAPVYELGYQQAYPQQNNAYIESVVSSGFGKSLAAAIMAWYPVTSIIAIILGSSGLNCVKQAEQIAAQYGISAGGKNIAAKVLGKVGMIGGIVMTAFWAFYILYFIFIFAMIGAY